MSLQILIDVRIPKWRLARIEQLQGRSAWCPEMDLPTQYSWLDNSLPVSEANQPMRNRLIFVQQFLSQLAASSTLTSVVASYEHRWRGCFVKLAQESR